MVLDVVQSIWEGIQSLVTSFLTTDNIFYIGIGFTLLMVLFFFIKSALSYECKLERSVNRLNEWLFKHQTINENNLIEFNNLIKDSKSPKILRKHWQQYMLYRDKLPSEYMSAYNCIDKPAKTSSFTANIKNFIMIYRVTAAVTAFLSIITFASRDNLTLTYLSLALVTPILVLLIGLIFTLILRTMQNYNLASLYQTFHIFNRYIDKASATIPKYVDFEILFTKKEIKNGIPILGEYLEKRARQEQEELEEAQRNAVSHEEYDFSASGVDGSLVLERAMKESETYLNFKQRTLAEIQQFESEISTLKKNYENTSKDYQRKLQASKENMERLRQQQEESTNRIEVNYIRKQQQDEVKKQEQLEKDQDDATTKFNAEINSLSAEIEKRRADLEDRRQKVQAAMESEYQTFSSKLHKAIATDVEKESDAIVQKVTIEKDQYAQAITYLKGEVDNKDAIIAAKDQIIEELQIRLSQTANDYQEEQTFEDVGAYSEDVEDAVQEASEYQAEEYVAEDYVLEEQPEQIEETTEEPVAVEEEESEEETATQVEETTEEATEEQTEEQEEQADGHYDEKGYYWFADKTYYDANGLYHDLEGNVYDADGNLQAEGQEVETEEVMTEEPQEEVPVVEETAEEPTQEETVGAVAETAEAESAEEVAVAEDGEEVGQEQPQENIEQAENKEEALEEQPKRKAGRPRKEKTEEEQSSTEPKKRGRPRKEQTEDGEEVAPKRKAGRPKKEVSETEEDSTPKKRGRPRKEQTEEESTSTEPKKRGRPKKEKTEEEEKPKRKAGRPKKNEDHASLILKHLGESLMAASEQNSSSKRSAKKS